MNAAIYAIGVAALVLTAATPAWGACAWVLWAAPPHATRSQMFPETAYETREQCQRRADEENRVGGTVWACFPDTIDPRGPKGSSR